MEIIKFTIPFIFAVSIVGCATNSKLAPVDPIPTANTTDLATMTDCKTIKEQLDKNQQILEKYIKVKKLNTSANIASGIGSVLSLGMGGFDFVSNKDVNNVIKSYEDRSTNLTALKDKYCTE